MDRHTTFLNRLRCSSTFLHGLLAGAALRSAAYGQRVDGSHDLEIPAFVGKDRKQLPNRIETGALLAIRLHHCPRFLDTVGVMEHRFLGSRISIPCVERCRIEG